MRAWFETEFKAEPEVVYAEGDEVPAEEETLFPEDGPVYFGL